MSWIDDSFMWQVDDVAFGAVLEAMPWHFALEFLAQMEMQHLRRSVVVSIVERR